MPLSYDAVIWFMALRHAVGRFLVLVATAPFSFLFYGLTALRNGLFDLGWRQRRSLDVPTWSIGNLSMGGTGKTPITGFIAERMMEKGLRLAILSRGYGRRKAHLALEVHADTSWRDSGDEPLMLLKRLTRFAHTHGLHPPRVAVGPSRFLAASCLDLSEVDLVLLDDGFQHRQLHRDLDLVILSGHQKFPGRAPWHLLPSGFFRETVAALHRADGVFFTRMRSKEQLAWFQRQIEQKAPQVSQWSFSFALGDPQSLHPENQRHPGNGPCAAFAGIESPEKFFAALRHKGFDLHLALPLKDHQPLDQTQRLRLREFLSHTPEGFLLTTEKDAIKLDLCDDFAKMLFFIPMTVACDHPTALDEFLQKKYLGSRGNS